MELERQVGVACLGICATDPMNIQQPLLTRLNFISSLKRGTTATAQVPAPGGHVVCRLAKRSSGSGVPG